MAVPSTLLSGLIPVTCLSILPSSAQIVQNEPPKERPNILWISTEDLSPRLGCYGDSIARTPNIDRLASEGTRFTNVFTTAAISSPCRAGIITGMYQTSIGCMHMRTTTYRRSAENPMPYLGVPPHYVKAFTEYLRAASYYCTNNSKTDYQFARDPVPESIWNECGNTAHYKNRPDKDQPFFAVFNYVGTHESRNWDIDNVKTDPSTVEVPPYYPDTEIVRRNLAKVYDNAARLDSVVAVLLDELEKEGVAENTVVFFWSDHGDGLPRAKRWLYDSGLHVPLIVRWPKQLQPGTVNDDMISSIDFGPTVLSLAGVRVPVHMQGQPFLGSQAAMPRQYVFAARDRVDESYDMVRSVRDKDFLYIRNFYPNEPYPIWVPYANRMPIMQEVMRLDAENRLNAHQKSWMSYQRPPEELYDVKADPFQLNNLAENPEYGEILEEMRGQHEKWTIETGDLGHMNESELIERMWPSGIQPVTDKPYFIINAEEERGAKNYQGGGSYSFPMTVAFYCPTHGASIVYSTDDGANPQWKLYSGPLHLPKGTHTIRIKAVRYGYKGSDEVVGVFDIK